jgi:hypothetical protein
MGNQNNKVSIDQEVMNNILQKEYNSCVAVCESEQSGNTIIIDGSTITGDVGLRQVCKANASCLMTNSIDAEVSNIIEDTIKQSNTTVNSLFSVNWNNQTNSTNIKSIVTNNVTQILTNTCNANESLNQSNNLLYISKSTIKGDFIGFALGDDATNANAACTMSNLAKLVVYNKVQADVSQSNTAIDIGAVILLVIMLMILIWLFKGKSS